MKKDLVPSVTPPFQPEPWAFLLQPQVGAGSQDRTASETRYLRLSSLSLHTLFSEGRFSAPHPQVKNWNIAFFSLSLSGHKNCLTSPNRLSWVMESVQAHAVIKSSNLSFYFLSYLRKGSPRHWGVGVYSEGWAGHRAGVFPSLSLPGISLPPPVNSGGICPCRAGGRGRREEK